MGYQQASHIQGAIVDNELLPSLTNIIFSDDIEQQPEILPADDNVDIEHPETATLLAEEPKATDINEADTGSQNIRQAVPSAETVQAPTDTKNAVPAIDDKPRKIRFSIQVGIYGSLKNARKMQEKLQAQNLDAYVSGNANKQSKLRFNVRIGYFEDKKSAALALKNYRNIQKGDGYLVNFTDKYIITEDEDNSQQSTIEPAPVDASVSGTEEAGNVEMLDTIKKSQESGQVN